MYLQDDTKQVLHKLCHIKDGNVPSFIMNSIINHHWDDLPIYCCLQCTAKFNTITELRDHLTVMHCRDNFLKPQDLLLYVRCRPPREKCFQCVVCSAAFSKLSPLMTHVKAHIDTELGNYFYRPFYS